MGNQDIKDINDSYISYRNNKRYNETTTNISDTVTTWNKNVAHKDKEYHNIYHLINQRITNQRE